MMSRAVGRHRSFASLRMTRLRIAVILSEAKNLYELKTDNMRLGEKSQLLRHGARPKAFPSAPEGG